MGVGDVYTMPTKISRPWAGNCVSLETTRVSIGDLVAGFESGKYSMSPLQRGDVYSDEQRCALITSVIDCIPIGEIAFILREDQTYEILDGGHRMRTLRAYLRGDFVYEAPRGGSKACKDYSGMRYTDLDGPKKRYIANVFVSVAYFRPSDTASPDALRKWSAQLLSCKLSSPVQASADTVRLVSRAASDGALADVLPKIRGVISEVVRGLYSGGEANRVAASVELDFTRRPSKLLAALSRARLLGGFSEDALRSELFQRLPGILCAKSAIMRQSELALCIAYAFSGLSGKFSEFRANVDNLFAASRTRNAVAATEARLVLAVQDYVCSDTEIVGEVLAYIRSRAVTQRMLYDWTRARPRRYRELAGVLFAEGKVFQDPNDGALRIADDVARS